MSSFKEKLSKSGQSVLDARAQNLYELAKNRGRQICSGL